VRRDDACAQRELAAGAGCRVDQCDHGTVHLTVGALTLRLSPEQLAGLAATLAAAAERLGAPARPERWLC
jgi:hypothetical protein